MLTATNSESHQGFPMAAPIVVPQVMPREPGSHYDLTAVLPPKLVTRILNLEFNEMAELVTNAWQDDSNLSPDAS